VKREDRSKLME